MKRLVALVVHGLLLVTEESVGSWAPAGHWGVRAGLIPVLATTPFRTRTEGWEDNNHPRWDFVDGLCGSCYMLNRDI